ncbi:MAG: conjugal transfer protein TraF [Chromatiaceae bacterium]|nr:MAG: conjugal transfer protein TraF [Chromatiaceae bacterium]
MVEIYRWHRLALLGALLTLVSTPVLHAQTAFYDRKSEGWFFYQDPPPPPEPIPAPPPPVTPSVETAADEAVGPAPADGPAPLSSAWLREHLDRFRDQAIDDPSAHNVAVYLYLQRAAMDKATRFAEATQRVVLADPFLDETTARPLATFGANLANQLAATEREALLTRIASLAVIWFFYRADCPYCEAQAPLLDLLSTRYGFHVMAIALDGQPLPGGWFPNYRIDQGQATQLGVVSTPALFLVHPDVTPPVAPIAQGVLSLAQLEDRIPRTAVAAGWISEADFRRARPVDHGFAMQPSGAPLPDDPQQLLRYLRAHLRPTQ